jgi:hypothetical protein
MKEVSLTGWHGMADRRPQEREAVKAMTHESQRLAKI